MATISRESEVAKRRAVIPFFLAGIHFILIGIALYASAIVCAAIALVPVLATQAAFWSERLMWYSGVPMTAGLLLCAIDIGLALPQKRRIPRWVEGTPNSDSELKSGFTITLTAYNDEESIAAAVTDFLGHPSVRRVIVVNNNSSDRTAERAREAGAVVYDELAPGYGQCVFRCLTEALQYADARVIVVCEGDRTFRARDLDKLASYLPHAELVNGTRIAEQLRAYRTQLSTFMYYGNFFVGKLLEAKHLGRGTFTDVGTTYKMIRRQSLERLLPHLNPAVNLEFNAHFLDTALSVGILTVECPITFHARVGASKGGNTNDIRALKVGLNMILGITFGWKRRHPSVR